jgi:anti-sigma factor RsiW
MKCNSAHELFSAAFDGELSVAEEKEFKGHISSCRNCSREFSLFSRSVRLVSSLSKPAVNPFFEARLKCALSERQEAPLRERSSPLVLRPAIDNKLATNELALSNPDLSEVGGVPVQPLELTDPGAVPGSYDADQLSPDGETAWSTRDTRSASSHGSSGTAVPAWDDMANAKDAVLEVEFVLDPFFLQGTEVRRLETASASGVEPELVSMTF